MPYIKLEDRQKVLETGIATTVGEMNFLITHEIHLYILTNGLNYQAISDVNKVLFKLHKDHNYFNNEKLDQLSENIGTIFYSRKSNLTSDDFLISLQLAAQEFYRTVVAPYENTKMLENGNISELDRNFISFDYSVINQDPDDNLNKLR